MDISIPLVSPAKSRRLLFKHVFNVFSGTKSNKNICFFAFRSVGERRENNFEMFSLCDWRACERGSYFSLFYRLSCVRSAGRRLNLLPESISRPQTERDAAVNGQVSIKRILSSNEIVRTPPAPDALPLAANNEIALKVEMHAEASLPRPRAAYKYDCPRPGMRTIKMRQRRGMTR